MANYTYSGGYGRVQTGQQYQYATSRFICFIFRSIDTCISAYAYASARMMASCFLADRVGRRNERPIHGNLTALTTKA